MKRLTIILTAIISLSSWGLLMVQGLSHEPDELISAKELKTAWPSGKM